ncbi:hypothetical protein LzC2_11950 [Planctomycetes bacterium LzC2]|uniref:Uncharacterized protein n=1 Tax=Alienimonas chondri TaxID=2681879 RepID=A0ABX1VB73_9PLAN|nr:hypothetical protein [Alienimonas chondri]
MKESLNRGPWTARGSARAVNEPAMGEPYRAGASVRPVSVPANGIGPADVGSEPVTARFSSSTFGRGAVAGKGMRMPRRGGRARRCVSGSVRRPRIQRVSANVAASRWESAGPSNAREAASESMVAVSGRVRRRAASRALAAARAMRSSPARAARAGSTLRNRSASASSAAASVVTSATTCRRASPLGSRSAALRRSESAADRRSSAAPRAVRSSSRSAHSPRNCRARRTVSDASVCGASARRSESVPNAPRPSRNPSQIGIRSDAASSKPGKESPRSAGCAREDPNVSPVSEPAVTCERPRSSSFASRSAVNRSNASRLRPG